jgi:putative membrane protein
MTTTSSSTSVKHGFPHAGNIRRPGPLINYAQAVVERPPEFSRAGLRHVAAGHRRHLTPAGAVVWVENKFDLEAPLGPQILSLLGIILGLLLVFRTNTAYDRWCEGRRFWGQLTNVSRALARQLDAMLPGEAKDRRNQYAELLAAWPHALILRLRGHGLREPDRLTSELVCWLQADIRGGALPREALVALMPMMTAFNDIQGGCERILKTPIPFSYSSYVKQFVLLFALLAPFALADEFGYGTIIAEMFIFFSTMG